MRLSKRGEYALRVLIRLGVSTAAGRPLLTIGELAGSERIPRSFLEQILLQLRNAGYLKSRRGARGGYALARPAHRIRLGAVIRLLDGTLAPVSCVSRIDYAPCTCPDEDRCGLRMAMSDVRAAMTSVLDRTTVADVAARVAAAPSARARRGRRSRTAGEVP